MERKQGSNRTLRKKDGLFSKRIVRQVLFVVNLFTVVVLLVSWATGGTGLDTLIKEWFGFFKVEVLALAGIKVSKETSEALKVLFGAREKGEDEFYG